MKFSLFLIKSIKTCFLFTANDHMQANTVCRKAVIMLPSQHFFNNFDIINFDVCWNHIKIVVIRLHALLC